MRQPTDYTGCHAMRRMGRKWKLTAARLRRALCGSRMRASTLAFTKNYCHATERFWATKPEEKAFYSQKDEELKVLHRIACDSYFKLLAQLPRRHSKKGIPLTMIREREVCLANIRALVEFGEKVRCEARRLGLRLLSEIEATDEAKKETRYKANKRGFKIEGPLPHLAVDLLELMLKIH